MKTKLLTAVFLMIGINSYQQILYTDLIPDIQVYPENGQVVQAEVDIDQNGSFDFNISMYYVFYYDSIYGQFYYETSTGIGMYGISSIAEEEAGIPSDGCIMLDLPPWVIINFQNFTWVQISGLWHIQDGMIFCNQYPQTKYYAISLYKNGSYYLGWIRIFSSGYLTIIYEMAINLTPNEPIFPGQTSLTSINQVNFEEVKIYPNPATVELNIRQPENNLQVSKLLIISPSGEIIKTITLNPVQLNTINISDIPKGMYLLQFIGQQKSYYEKLIVY